MRIRSSRHLLAPAAREKSGGDQYRRWISAHVLATMPSPTSGSPPERAGNHRSGSLRLLTPQDVQLDAPDQAGDVIPRHGFFDFVVGNDEQELARPHVVP